MLKEDIKNKKTLTNVEKYSVDLSQFDDVTELRNYLRKLKMKEYNSNHKQYFRDYMRQKLKDNEFRKKHYDLVYNRLERNKSSRKPVGRPRIEDKIIDI